MDTVLKYLENILGLSLLAWAIIISFLIYLVWKISAKYAIYKHKTDNLPCDKHEDAIDKLTELTQSIHTGITRLDVGMDSVRRHEETILRLTDSINEVNKSISGLEARFDTQDRAFGMLASAFRNSRFTQSQSPISLTDDGRKVAESLGFKSIIDKDWENISSMAAGAQNPYDIQMAFMTGFTVYPEKYIDKDSLDHIKRDAFLRGLPLIEYMRMLAIISRDNYFKIHGIDISAVDK